MSTYYLIARSRKDNAFRVIKLKEAWYLGKEEGREDVFTRSNDLEAIDLVTTRFASEIEMAERMTRNGYISDGDVDIFIASKQEKDGKSYIKFEEAIYTPEKNKRSNNLRRVAMASLENDFKNNQDDLFSIYDELIETVYLVDDFYFMLLEGGSNVPRSIVEQLRGIKMCPENPYDVKDSLEFSVDGYSSIRNMVEALNRFERLSFSSREDRIKNNMEFVEKNLNQRMTILPELCIKIDENYVDEQLSLFSLLNKKASEKKQGIPQDIIDEEKKSVDIIHIPRKGVTDAEKKKTVYRILKNLPRNAIFRDKSSREFKVNYNLFKHYPPSEEEMKKLNTYLTGKLPKYFAEYINDYAMLCDAREVGVSSSYELEELQSYLDSDIKKIDKLFQSSKCVNMAYEWCVLYAGAIKRNTAYAPVCTDDKAKVYEKKQ